MNSLFDEQVVSKMTNADKVIALGVLCEATKPKRKKAKKIRTELGPYETTGSGFDRGTRPIEIVRITPAAITYRLRGKSEEYALPHGTAFQKAVSLQAGIDTGPRTGAIKRGGVS